MLISDLPGIGVIGCGYWGRNLVRCVHELGALGAVCDPTPTARQTAQELVPDVPVFDQPEDLLAESGIDAVMIATPAETHYALASRALAGGKHVFVEKPLTVTVEDGVRLDAQARAAERVLMVGHLLEYHPAILKLRELIREGVLGKIRYIVSHRLNLGKIRSEENALWSFAPHDIAVILRLVGQLPFQVVATGGSYLQPNIADVTVTQLLFDNGVRSHVFVSWLHPFKEQRLVVIGSKRMATFDDVAKQLTLYDLEVHWEQGQPVPVRHQGAPVEFGSDEPLLRECQHFLECVATGKAPLTDAESGIRVLRILHAAQRSMILNGSQVVVPDGAGSAHA
jgi:predicted dehydrogenase